MFAIERRNKLLALLNERKSLSVQDAAAYFSVAEETIRRDFNLLEEQNLLIRTHGGAFVADDPKQEISYESRKQINISGKDSIAAEAAKLVKDGETIILDASTSSFFLAKYIKNKKGLTVITNAENVITELSDQHGIEIISTGGVLRRKSMSYVGSIAESALGHYQADKLFFSCMGFSLQRGLTDSNGQESDIKKIMMSRCQKKIFLCDHTKIDKIGYASTAKTEDIDVLITNKEFSPDVLSGLVDLGVTVTVAR